MQVDQYTHYYVPVATPKTFARSLVRPSLISKTLRELLSQISKTVASREIAAGEFSGQLLIAPAWRIRETSRAIMSISAYLVTRY